MLGFGPVLAFLCLGIACFDAYLLNQAKISGIRQNMGRFSSEIPKPKVIKPNDPQNEKKSIEKFMMMYTCKICNQRNAQMVSKVAYTKGMVISTCKGCKSKHFISDNEGKLDMGEYGKKIEDFLVQNGENVQRMALSRQELEDNYLVDDEAELKLQPKIGGQVSSDSTIIDLPILGGWVSNM